MRRKRLIGVFIGLTLILSLILTELLVIEPLVIELLVIGLPPKLHP